MKQVSIGWIVMICLLSSPAYCINYKRLDEEAQSCFTKIWSGPFLSKPKVREKLTFMHEEDEKVKKYSDSQKFQKLYDSLEAGTSKKKLPGIEPRNQRFLEFAKMCEEIFQEENDVLKASVYQLLKRVYKKYTEAVTANVKHRERYVPLPEVDPDPEATKALRAIMANADNCCVIPEDLKRRLKTDEFWPTYK